MKNEPAKYKIFAILLSLLSSGAIWAQNEMSSHDPLLIGISAALFFCFRAALLCRERRAFVCASLLGLLFALFTVLGKLYAMSEAKNFTVWLIIRFFGFWAMFTAVLVVLFGKLKDVTLIDPAAGDRSAKKCRRVFFVSFLALAAVYSLWWLYEYPGNTSPDSNNQILQAMGLSPLSNHHPAVNTLFLGAVFRVGLKLFAGSQNAALGLYTFVQLLFMAFCFAYTTASLYREGIRKSVVIAVLTVYLLIPYHGSYSVTVWKDVPFGGMMLLLCITLWQLMERGKKGEKAGAGLLSLFAFSAFGVCLLRSNGLYSFILTLPFILIVFRKRNAKALSIAVGVAVMSILITGPLYSSFDIKPADFVESISIPAQQISRVIVEDGHLTEEQEDILGKIIDISAVSDTYNENISDPIKALIRASGNVEYLSNHKREYLKLWINIGLSHPGSYIRAFIDQTKGYWYPDVQYWSMSTYCAESEEVDIYKARKLPERLGKIFADSGFYAPTLPICGLFFSIGLASWILLSLFFLCIIRKKFSHLLVFVPVLAMMATLLIATPVYAEFRYAYGMFTALPLLCILPFDRNCRDIFPERIPHERKK